MHSEVRQPRLRVSVAGVELSGVLAAEIHSNNHFAADRFRVRLAAAAVQQTILHNPDLRIEVRFGVEGLWRSLIVGTIDSVTLDPVAGVVSIAGRDLSSLLIEAQTNETFPNRTASEIAQILAGRHGLIALVQNTTTPVGRYYQSERDRLTLGQLAKSTTEWDLLAVLAAREGFDLYMEGDALWFGQSVIDAVVTIAPSDCVGLDLQHCVPLARPIEVTVRSWQSRTGESIAVTAMSAGIGQVWRRGLTRPNLSANEADSLAKRSIADLKRHEWTANVTMPGDLALTSRSRVALLGTGSAWDRDYVVTSL